MTLTEFNGMANPFDDICYIIKVNGSKHRVDFSTLQKELSVNPNLDIAYKLQRGYIILETESEFFATYLKTVNEGAYIVEKLGVYWILCKGIAPKATRLLLACGLSVKAYVEGESVPIPLPPEYTVIHEPQNLECTTLSNYAQVTGKPKTSDPGLTLPITSDCTRILCELKAKLVRFTPKEQQQLIYHMGMNFCDPPLTKDEIQNILDSKQQELYNSFFQGDVFLHNKLGDYLVTACSVRRDSLSQELFYFDNANQVYCKNPEYLRGYMTKLCPQLKAYQKDEVMNYITDSLYDSTTQFNTNPNTIVFKNGILDISDMTFDVMSPRYLESIQVNCDYNPQAQSPTADEFFDTATIGDKEVEQLLYEAIGYSMLKTAELQKAFILVGEGRNGKSTYFDLLRAVLGRPNTTSISFKDLSNNFRASGMYGKLASLAGDISSQPLSDSDMIKAISSGDYVLIEEKYKAAKDVSLFCTMFFGCNKLPKTPDTSFGFYRRFTIIPFIANLSAVTPVDGMAFKKKLLQPESLEYVAYKSVEAIRNVMNNTRCFTEPKTVVDMMEKYRRDNSTVLSWFADMGIDTATADKMGFNLLWTKYKSWCATSGRPNLSQTNFKNTLKTELGIDKTATP